MENKNFKKDFIYGDIFTYIHLLIIKNKMYLKQWKQLRIPVQLVTADEWKWCQSFNFFNISVVAISSTYNKY